MAGFPKKKALHPKIMLNIKNINPDSLSILLIFLNAIISIAIHKKEDIMQKNIKYAPSLKYCPFIFSIAFFFKFVIFLSSPLTNWQVKLPILFYKTKSDKYILHFVLQYVYFLPGNFTAFIYSKALQFTKSFELFRFTKR